MSRRTVAGLVALGLIAGLVVFGVSKPTGYVTWRPGPTLDVLGDYDGKAIVTITGRKSYRDDGQLRMVTVYESRRTDKLNLAEVISGWIDPDVAVLPYKAVFPDNKSAKQDRKESVQQMSSSQDDATAAALSALDIAYRTETVVASVVTGGASDGKLRAGDVLLAIDGKPLTSSAALLEKVQSVKPGTPLRITVRRNGKPREITVVTRADAQDAKITRINIAIGEDYAFPFKVNFSLSDSIGGPSAGMIFALTIYDLLTPGSLTGGKTIAGTGEISADGVVSPIGGIGQKIVGAQRDGARLFLVPEENCSDAAHAHYDEDKITLVRIHTLSDAIKDLRAWSKDPDVSLPRCTK